MTLQTFVENARRKITNFDCTKREHIKVLIKLAIEQFGLKTIEKIENTASGNYEVLYLPSIYEENLLTKIVEIASGEEQSIEMIYDSHVVRRH